MGKKLILSGVLFFIFTINISSAQEAPVSLLDEVSYVYVEKLIAIAKENYPRVKAHNSRLAIAESAVGNAKLGWLTPLSLSYVYSPSNTLNLTNPTFFSGYQIGFAFNLSAVLQTPATIKQTKEELKIAKYDYDEYMGSLATEVKTKYFGYLQAVKILKLISQAHLDVQNSYTLIKYKFERGETPFLDYNAASTSLTASNQSKIAAEVTLLQAKAELEELLGIRLEEVPN
jgi:outer membrane protein TolC